MVDCGRVLNRSSTVAESGLFIVAPYMYLWSFVGVRVNRGITDTRLVPIHPDSSRTQYEEEVVVLPARFRLEPC